MIKKVKVPRISANVTDATVTAWFKKEGEAVEKGEMLLELTTEKAAFDIESPCKGVLRRRLAPEKSTVPEGYVLALVGGAADILPDVDAANRKLIMKHKGLAAAPVTSKTAPPKRAAGGERVRATPAARRISKEKLLDLANISSVMRVEVVTEEVVLRYLKDRKGGAV